MVASALNRLFCGCLAPATEPQGAEEASQASPIPVKPAQMGPSHTDKASAPAKGAPAISLHVTAGGAPIGLAPIKTGAAAQPAQGPRQAEVQRPAAASEGGEGGPEPDVLPAHAEEGTADAERLPPATEPPQAPVVAALCQEDAVSVSSAGACAYGPEESESEGSAPASFSSPAAAASPGQGSASAASSPAKSAAAGSSPAKSAAASSPAKSAAGSSPAKSAAASSPGGASTSSASFTSTGASSVGAVARLRKHQRALKAAPADGSAAKASPPTTPSGRALSRSSLHPPMPADLAAALQNLGTPHPVDPIFDLNVVRAAAVHTPEELQLQLGSLVQLLLRTMRAPRLGTARAAILTFTDLFSTPGLGPALCGHIADDSSPTSPAVLALMLKATGGDLNSKRIAADANACLCTMVQTLPTLACIEMLQGYCTSDKSKVRVRAKAAALLTAVAYRLARTDQQACTKAVLSSLLQTCEPLLGSGSACRKMALSLAVVAHSAFTAQPDLHLPPSPPARKAGEQPAATPEPLEPEDAWTEFVRLTVEPEAAAAIAEAVEAQPPPRSAEEGFARGLSPVAEVAARLVLVSE